MVFVENCPACNKPPSITVADGTLTQSTVSCRDRDCRFYTFEVTRLTKETAIMVWNDLVNALRLNLASQSIHGKLSYATETGRFPDPEHHGPPPDPVERGEISKCVSCGILPVKKRGSFDHGIDAYPVVLQCPQCGKSVEGDDLKDAISEWTETNISVVTGYSWGDHVVQDGEAYVHEPDEIDNSVSWIMTSTGDLGVIVNETGKLYLMQTPYTKTQPFGPKDEFVIHRVFDGEPPNFDPDFDGKYVWNVYKGE